jgi:hypothetical protein
MAGNALRLVISISASADPPDQSLSVYDSAVALYHSLGKLPEPVSTHDFF